MDFGALGLNGFVGSDNGGAPDTKMRIFGSGLAKHERSSGSAQDDWRSLKMTRTDDVAAPKTMPLHQVAPLLRSNSFASGDTRQQEYMLSFSALKPDAASFLSTNSGLTERSTQNHTGLPHYQLKPSAYARSSGYGGGSLNGNLHVPFTGVTGSFTPSQWMELEHQALIYKHIASNVPVPSNLVIPFKKPLYAYGLASSSTGSFPTNPLGWASFPLGYSGNSSDLEPKRCRRTDGKKWRCSRDAVADQKYCERHLNRGRNRSRKPVEGQTGHAATGTTNSKVVPMTTSMSTLIRTSGGASKSLAISHQQFKNSQPAAPHSSADAFVNRLILSKVNDIGREQDLQGKSMVSSTLNLKSDGSTLTIPKQGIRTEGWSPSELGLISFDSLGNPPLRVSYISSKSYESILNRNDPKAQDQDPTHQLTDDWPKDLSNHSLISWPEELKSDCTQLSMSIPMVSADFLSSSSSPTREKCVLSPLRLSRKVDPIQIGLGARGDHSESSQKLNNWMPISWGSSMGNPLGEVLTASTGSLGSWKNSSALNLLTEGWDDRPQLGSSPTGVLQKATFVSLSNSSSGSTRTESKNNNG